MFGIWCTFFLLFSLSSIFRPDRHPVIAAGFHDTGRGIMATRGTFGSLNQAWLTD